MLRFFPLAEIIIVLALAAIIFGPPTLLGIRYRHRGSRLVD
jgi:hypothetical protein